MRGLEFERCRVYTVNASSSSLVPLPGNGPSCQFIVCTCARCWCRRTWTVLLICCPFGISSFVLESPQGQPGASLWRLHCVFERALEIWDLLAILCSWVPELERASVIDPDPLVGDSQSLVLTGCVLLVPWFQWSKGNSEVYVPQSTQIYLVSNLTFLILDVDLPPLCSAPAWNPLVSAPSSSPGHQVLPGFLICVAFAYFGFRTWCLNYCKPFWVSFFPLGLALSPF